MSDMDRYRRLHDAAVDLGAECEPECMFYDVDAGMKSWMKELTRAFTFPSNN